MHLSQFLAATSITGAAVAQETVLGVYIFSRHGDRTAKATPPTQLTDLGYDEVFARGSYYRNEYVSTNASRLINGINHDIVKQSQITASAPVDNVLQNSAMAFLQGIYPPAGDASAQTLRNGSIVQSPLNGYQLIPLQTVETGAGSEDSAWLQGSTNCANAQISSNDFFNSAHYLSTLNSSKSLYSSVYPMVNATFTTSQMSYKNAYVIWDLLNVASIHNQSAELPDAEVMAELAYLAETHEFGLAFNNTEPIRAVTGSIMAAEVSQALNKTIATQGKTKLNIQFGAYAGMMSFFGLSNLTETDPAFYGIPDYASTLVWELVTNATVSDSYPGVDELAVRFYYHNGTSATSPQPVEYPLFGTTSSPMAWSTFQDNMNKIAISSQSAWCQACGNTTGVCSSAYLSGEGDGSSSGSASSTSSSQGGVSKTVAGVIGAMVTLAVILLVQGIIILIGGFRLVSKKRLSGAAQVNEVNVAGGKA